LFNYWGGSETITVQWGDEVVIEGSSRIVSQVEDSLTWNAAFTNPRVTTQGNNLAANHLSDILHIE
jgi:hypothetical protein